MDSSLPLEGRIALVTGAARGLGFAIADLLAQHGAQVIRRILEHSPDESHAYRLFYNVNFPPCAASEVTGIEITTQGWRENTTFGVEPHMAPSGRMFLWVKGGPQHDRTGPGTDVTANQDVAISVTPLRADLTAHDMIETLKDRFGKDPLG